MPMRRQGTVTELVHKVSDICATYWHLLTDVHDAVRKLVLERPQLIYRRAHSLGHLLIHNDIWSPPPWW